MARTQKEHEVLRDAEKALDSDNMEIVHNALFELLNMHQKLSRRIDKILKQSDKQQERLDQITTRLDDISKSEVTNGDTSETIERTI